VTSQAAFGPPFFPALLFGVAALAGCATDRLYEGPRLPPEERAIVRADPVVSAGLPVQLRLRQVDGREVGVSASKVELPAGKHEILVDCLVAESGSVRRFTIEADVEAGGRYRVVANATTRNCEAVALIAE
jgi:hypothetical protein